MCAWVPEAGPRPPLLPFLQPGGPGSAVLLFEVELVSREGMGCPRATCFQWHVRPSCQPV